MSTQEHKEGSDTLDYITTKETSEILGITYDAVIKAIHRGAIKAHKFGSGMWMIKRESVEKYQTSRYVGYGRPRNKKKETRGNTNEEL